MHLPWRPYTSKYVFTVLADIYPRGVPRRGLLKDELPDIYAELHPTKNIDLETEKLFSGSDKRVWWLCQNDSCRPQGCRHEHAWEATVRSRRRQHNSSECPFCTGLRVCPCNSLAEHFPALMYHWVPAANDVPLGEPLHPVRISPWSHKRVWWRHDCGDGQNHHWSATINSVVNRFTASGQVPCPRCAVAARAVRRK